MAGKKEQLAAEAGSNMMDSIGANAAPSSPLAPVSRPPKLQGFERSKDVATIELDRIEPDPDQPRKEFDEEDLRRLAETLKADGQQQPIRVRWVQDRGKYMVIMGERRLKAARMAGLASLQCVVESRELTPAELYKLQMIENLARSDLRPIEQAEGFRLLMDEFKWSGNQLAKELGISQPSVVRALSLLKLDPEVRDKVASGEIPADSAYQVSQIPDPQVQKEVASQVVAGKLTREETSRVVREKRAEAKPAGKGRGGKSSAGPKLKTQVVRNDAGYKFRAENRKGVDPATLRPALQRWLESLPEHPDSATA
jgi:ParB family chromosome partitioning protein